MAFLWLSRWAPYAPLRGGDVEHTRALISALAQVGPTRVLAFEAPDVTPPADVGVQWTLLPHTPPKPVFSLVSPLPNVAFKYRSPAFLAKAIEMASEADVEAVFVDFIALAWLVEPLKRALNRRSAKTPVIMVNHNVEHAFRRQMVGAASSPAMRVALTLDAWKAGRLETAANRASDGLAAITGLDRDVLAGHSGKPGMVTSPVYDGPLVERRFIDEQVPRAACIIGNHASHHKRQVLQLALTALSAIGAEIDTHIEVAGNGEHDSFEAEFPGFHYRGYIEDLGGYLAGMRLGMLPDEIGGGFKYRVLMHGFMRVPMLAVHAAMNGMGFIDGVHYVGAETLEQMSAELPRLIDDFDRLNALQEAAFEHCMRLYGGQGRGLEMAAFARGLR